VTCKTGAHDFFPTETTAQTQPEKALSKTYGRQQIVMMTTPHPAKFPSGKITLLTVVINNSHASFYHNIDTLETVSMPRPMTDCFNNQEGILVGDTGMELGQLRFYPRALSTANVKEIFQYGSTLEDLATVLILSLFIPFSQKKKVYLQFLFSSFQMINTSDDLRGNPGVRSTGCGRGADRSITARTRAKPV